MATNTVAQASPMLVGYVASFVSAPIILSSLGLRAFGIWAFTGAIAQYASLLDFGVGPALVRFVALYAAEKREDKIGEVLGAGIVTSVLMGIILIIGCLLAAEPLAAGVHVTTGEMQMLLVSVSVIFTTNVLGNVLTAYPIGMQEMIAPNIATTVGSVLNFAFSVASALTSHSLVHYAVANALASALTLVIVAVVVRFSMRGRVRIGVPSLATLKTILSFSLNGQAVSAANLIMLETDKIILALMIGPATAGAYELGTRIAAAARTVGLLSVSAMMPTMTTAVVKADGSSISDSYLRWTKISAALGMPVLLCVAAMPSTILHAWLGSTPHDSSLVLTAISLGSLLGATTGVGIVFAQAKGRPGLLARAAIYMALANLVLTIALVPFIGLWGVLIGTAAAMTVGAIYQVWLVHKTFGIPLGDYVHAVRPSLLLGVTVAAPLLAVQFGCTHAGRLTQGIVAVGAASLFGVVYTLGANRLGILPDAISRRLGPLRRLSVT